MTGGNRPARPRRRLLAALAALALLGAGAAVGLLAGGRASGRSHAAAYIARLGPAPALVKTTLDDLATATRILQRTPTAAGFAALDRLTAHAYRALDAVRPAFATADPGALGRAEAQLAAAADELTSVIGAMDELTGSSGGAALSILATQFQVGSARWDAGVVAIWRLAHRPDAPTI